MAIMESETLHCTRCSNSVVLRGPGAAQTEAKCGQCGHRMEPKNKSRR